MVNLPRGEISAAGWHLPKTPSNLSAAEWRPASSALAEIINEARSAGANPVLALYLGLPALYAPYLPPDHPAVRAAEADYMDAAGRLEALARAHGAVFIDFTPAMRKGLAERQVTESDGDYHPNQQGVNIMAEEMQRVLEPFL